MGVLVHPAEIEALVRKGYLPSEEREKYRGLQIAINDLLTQLVCDLVCDV